MLVTNCNQKLQFVTFSNKYCVTTTTMYFRCLTVNVLNYWNPLLIYRTTGNVSPVILTLCGHFLAPCEYFVFLQGVFLYSCAVILGLCGILWGVFCGQCAFVAHIAFVENISTLWSFYIWLKLWLSFCDHFIFHIYVSWCLLCVCVWWPGLLTKGPITDEKVYMIC